jgi:hypothetical protein
MSQFVRAGRHLINLDNIVEAQVYEEGQPVPGIGSAADPKPEDISVVIVTTAPDFRHEEYAGEFLGTPAYEITLRNEAAIEFLGQIYIPSPNGHQSATFMAG